jgi:hypothetical protein
LPQLVLELVAALAKGDDDQDLPQVVAVEQTGEAVRFGASAEAGEGVQSRVFALAAAVGVRGKKVRTSWTRRVK